MRTGVSPLRVRMRHAAWVPVCALVAFPVLAEPAIKTGGTGSALRVISALGDAYKQTRPEVKIVVTRRLGSGGAIRALGVDAIDLALRARPLKPAERSLLFREMEVARIPLAFAGARAYPGPHAGKDCSHLCRRTAGLAGRQRVATGFAPGPRYGGSFAACGPPVMDRAVGKALARPGMHVALTDREAANALATVPGAFGLTTLTMLVDGPQSLRAFSLDGTAPGLASLNEGRYRMFKPLYLVLRANAAEQVHAWVAFIVSPGGAEILTAHGYQALAPTK